MTDKDPILTGVGGSQGFYTGLVRLVDGIDELASVEQGEVLVTRLTTPDYTGVFDKVGAIITDTGGVTSHAAIVARELGKPAVVGSKVATKTLHTGDKVSVDGNSGKVYRGKIEQPKDVIQASAETLEDYFTRSGDEFEDFLDFALIGMSQQQEPWPLPGSKLMPFIDMDQAVDMLAKLHELDARKLSDKEVMSLFETPVKARAFVMGIGIIGLKTAHKLMPEKVSIDDQIYLFRRILRIAKQLCRNDEDYLYGKTLYLDNTGVESVVGRILETQTNLDTSSSLSTATFILNWSFMWNYFNYGTNFLHGPYDVSSDFGEQAKLFVREYDFAGLSEIWPLASKIGYSKIVFYQVYKSNNVWTNIGSRIRGEGDMAHMQKQSIYADDKLLSNTEMSELIQHFKDITKQQVDFVNSLPVKDQIMHGAQNSYFAHKHFYEYFDKHWFPQAKVEATIEQLYDKIFTQDNNQEEAISITRSEVTKREMWDPRNDLLDFM